MNSFLKSLNNCIYLWLCWVFVAMWVSSLAVAALGCGVQASRGGLLWVWSIGSWIPPRIQWRPWTPRFLLCWVCGGTGLGTLWTHVSVQEPCASESITGVQVRTGLARPRPYPLLAEQLRATFLNSLEHSFLMKNKNKNYSHFMNC